MEKRKHVMILKLKQLIIKLRLWRLTRRLSRLKRTNDRIIWNIVDTKEKIDKLGNRDVFNQFYEIVAMLSTPDYPRRIFRAAKRGLWIESDSQRLLKLLKTYQAKNNPDKTLDS